MKCNAPSHLGSLIQLYRESHKFFAHRIWYNYLPVSLWGTENIFQPGSSLPKNAPVPIRIGEVISPPVSSKREALQFVTDRCAKIINELHSIGR